MEGERREDSGRKKGEGRGGWRRRDEGMTTRMARSYSLGYNSAVLGQCKLNESSPARTDGLAPTFHPLIPAFSPRPPSVATTSMARSAVGHTVACRTRCSNVNSVNKENNETQKCPTDLDRLMRVLKRARRLPARRFLLQARPRGHLDVAGPFSYRSTA